MRYVAIKSPEQQAALALHRTRDLFVSNSRTQLVNMIRGLLAEFAALEISTKRMASGKR